MGVINLQLTPRLLVRLAFWLAALFALLMASLPHPPQLPGQPSDEVQHIIASVVVTLLFRVAYPTASTTLIFLSLAAFGAAIEFFQSIPALHRDASILDWIVGCLAIAATLGMLIAAKKMAGLARPKAPEL